MRKKKYSSLLFLILLTLSVFLNSFLYADTIRILFIGNSFTHMNEFPMMFEELVAASGNTAVVDYSAVDSYTLEKHSKYQETLEKISYSCWDYVVLQEQSQRPAMDSLTFYNKTLFYADYLDSVIRFYNPDAQVLLFMTWGRKNGDKELCKKYSSSCSYNEMQKIISERYNFLASKLAVSVVPCGLGWSYFQNEKKDINLYDEDEKHSNIIGSYLNACVFYSVLFNKSPEGEQYNPANLSNEELLVIQAQAYLVAKKTIGLFESIRKKTD